MTNASSMLFTAIALGLLSAGTAGADSDDERFFEQHVRPLLVERCVDCHGDEDPEGGLTLTSRQGLLKGGDSGPAVLLDAPEQSRLLTALSYKSMLRMPPDGRLKDEQIQNIAQWLGRGIPWPETTPAVTKGQWAISQADRDHWAFQPIADPPLPETSQPGWLRTSVDAFILSKLDGAGLKPSPPADRRTLIRRAYFDLIGLPPSWEEVEAFVQNDSENAYADVIERLLASPRYGERWGRHWLDVARYADSKDGVLMYGDDRIRPYAYAYRDYVIRAFNEDLPFDQFIREQLAADQIEPPVDPPRLAAMGFLTLGRMFDNNVHDVIDDQIDTVTRGFLGLTVSCARCHDHKYDPIPTADYYSLHGVFSASQAPLIPPLIQDPAELPGGIEFEKEADEKRKQLLAFLDEQYQLLSGAARDRIGDYLVHVATTKPDPLESAIYFLSLAPDDLRPPIVARWRRHLERKATPDDPVFGLWHDLIQAVKPSADSQAAQPSDRFADFAQKTLDRWKKRPLGVEPGEVNPLILKALSEGELSSPADVATAYGKALLQAYEDSQTLPATAGTASAPLNPGPTEQLAKLVAGPESPAYFPKSQTRRYMSRAETDRFGGMLGELDRMAVQSPAAPARAMILEDAPTIPRPRILVRGNPTQLGEPVPRRFLEILKPEREPFPHGSGRLDLADAIADPDNPLTARVIVNRVWMHHFGEPIVSTPSDFGRRSDPPSHPELLDHLASRLIEENWSFKALHRRIMLSASYRQSSRPSETQRAAAREVDPENRLLWRAHRRRLDFEAMRDGMLAAANRLDSHDGGRPVDIAADPRATNRTVYSLIDRQSLPGVFRAFDFAIPDVSVERRPRTMVPQQALFALNSSFVLIQAEAIAKSVLDASEDDAERVRLIVRQVLGRDAAEDEIQSSLAFLNDGREPTADDWKLLAQTFLISNEFMYVD